MPFRSFQPAGQPPTRPCPPRSPPSHQVSAHDSSASAKRTSDQARNYCLLPSNLDFSMDLSLPAPPTWHGTRHSSSSLSCPCLALADHLLLYLCIFDRSHAVRRWSCEAADCATCFSPRCSGGLLLPFLLLASGRRPSKASPCNFECHRPSAKHGRKPAKHYRGRHATWSSSNTIADWQCRSSPQPGLGS